MRLLCSANQDSCTCGCALLIPDVHPDSIAVFRFSDGRERRVSLPAKWWDNGRPDYQPFKTLSDNDKLVVAKCVTSFSYFMHHAFFPKFCHDEHKPYPKKLFPHVDQWAQTIQRSVHPFLLPFDVFDDEQDDGYRVCIVAPNASLKTTTVAYAFPLWMVGVNNGVRIIMASATKTLADQKSELLKAHITNNEAFIEIFGNLHSGKGSQKWEAGYWSVDDHGDRAAPNVAAYGMFSAIESARTDIGIADDVQNIENAKTSDARAKAWLWLSAAFESRMDAVTRLELVIQTRQAMDDIAGRAKEEAEKTRTWKYSEWDAVSEWPPTESDFIDPGLDDADLYRVENLHDPEAWRDKLLCPDVLPLEMMLEEWVPTGRRDAFYRTRMNRIRDPETKWFSRDILVETSRADGGQREDGTVRPKLSAWDTMIGLPQPGSELFEQFLRGGITIGTRVISVDTAASAAAAGKDPDWTVIQLWGMDNENHIRVLLDMVRFRTSSPEVFRRRLGDFVYAYQPHYTIMESNGMAKWGVKDAQAEIGSPIIPYNRGKYEVVEVETFKTLMESQLMLYCWGDERSKHKMRPFEDELDDYPDPGSHDDTLITAVQAQSKLLPRGTREVRVHTGRPKSEPEIDDESPALAAMLESLNAMSAVLKELSTSGKAA